MNESLKGMILAAGLGTRLRPLTSRWPKPAMPLLGRPLLAYHLAALKAAGIRSVCINTHHLPEEMEACARQETARAELSLEVSRETQIQGTGGGIRGLRPFLKDGVFVVWNGDNFYDLDLTPIIATHRKSKASATMVLRPMPIGESYGAVEVDPEGWVRRISGHGPGGLNLVSLHFAGVHVLNPEVFDFIGDGPEDINRDVYPRMISNGLGVRGHLTHQGYWSDLGTPDRYLKTQRDILERRSPMGVLEALLPKAFENVIDAGARVDPRAKLGQSIYVGPNARIEAGATLDRACILEDTQIRSGETVCDAIAWREHRIHGTDAVRVF